jgi:hypothetical protein
MLSCARLPCSMTVNSSTAKETSLRLRSVDMEG